MSSRLRRSELATPATNDWMFDTAAQCGADLVFLDLEDGVPADQKELARSRAITGLVECSWGSTQRAVRINALDTPWAHDDVIAIVSQARDALDTVIVPKVATARDVWWVDVLLTQLEAKLALSKQIRLEAVIETVAGVVHAEEIAGSSRRLDALIFGAGDYSLSQGSRVDSGLRPLGDYQGDLWHYARSKVLIAARLEGLDAIDAVYPQYRDEDGYAQAARYAATLGYSGKGAIHPAQVPIANEVFTPGEDDVARARSILQVYADAQRQGRGAVGVDGMLVDALHARQAEATLAQVQTVKASGSGAKET